MAHVQIIEDGQATDPQVIQVYEEIKAELGFGIVPNLFKSMATRPGFLEASWIHFRSTVLEGRLPRTLKEMVGILVSKANRSVYALEVHLHSLSALGISEAVLARLVDDFDACPLPETEKVALRFGLRAATAPHDLGPEDFALLEKHGLSGEEAFELIATAHLFNGINQYTDAISLELDAI